MKALLFYENSAATMEQIMSVYPRHKAIVLEFAGRGEAVASGPYTGPNGERDGALIVFRTRESAEAFVKKDPFVLEGLVGTYKIRDWNEGLLP